jgi:hypothetical protein
MNWRQTIFVLMAIAAAGSALARAPVPTPKDNIKRLQHLLTRKAYAVNRVEWLGDALTIIHFSDRACRDMKVMPVSVVLQEGPLLKEVGAPGDTRYFLYGDHMWQMSRQPPVALAHVGQQFVEIAHLQPRPALDTMLFFVLPKNCRVAPDWSEFWRPDQGKAARL